MPLDENGRTSYDNAKDFRIALVKCNSCRRFMWSLPGNRPLCKDCSQNLGVPFSLRPKEKKVKSQ